MIADMSVVAVLATLASASVMALATAVQQRATQRAPGGRGRHIAMVVTLARDPWWLASLAGIGLGFGLYLVALSLGALTLTQPIMVIGLVLGSVFAARLAGRRLDRGLLLGGVLCGGGLALLLGLARPASGHYVVDFGSATVTLGIVVVALLLGTWIAATRTQGLARAVALALAAGLLFGVNAALAKLAAEQLTGHQVGPWPYWPWLAMLLTAPAGFALSQRAMQLGRLLAPVNAIISTMDPLAAVAIGVVAFGERMVTTPAALVVELVAATIVVVGITVVTRRGARLIEADQAARNAAGRAALSWG